MYHPYPLYFLVMILASGSADEKGNVLEFGPKGNFNYIISNHENDLADEDSKLENFWIQQDNKNIVQLVCNKFEINSMTKDPIEEYRATLTTTGNVELDSFVVNDCVKGTLEDGIVVTQSKDDELRKEYQIIFKDDEGRCRQRGYVVEITSNPVKPIVTVTRSTPLTITNRKKCPIRKVQKLASAWFQDGPMYDFALFNDYMTWHKFANGRGWFMCRKATNGDFLVDLAFDKAPLDRIKVSSCSKTSLRISMKLDLFTESDDRMTIVYMNYLKPDGTCMIRKYQYDIQAYRDVMLSRALVISDDPIVNAGCKPMKALGLARSLVLMATRHFGRITNFTFRPKPGPIKDEGEIEESIET